VYLIELIINTDLNNAEEETTDPFGRSKIMV
jgi:hypothetical protein